MQKQSFLVLGGRHEAQTILHVLLAFGVDVIAHHDETAPSSQSMSVALSAPTIAQYAALAGNQSANQTTSIPQVDQAAAAHLLKDNNVGLIVASHHVTNAEDQFLDACTYARNQLNFTGQPVHLAALCDLFSYPPTRYLLTGIASSGNIVFQNILAALLKTREHKPVLAENTVAQLLASFAIHHAYSLQRLFARHMTCAMENVLLSATHTQFGQCLIQTEDRYSSLYGLPLRSYAWAGEWSSTHEPVNENMLMFYKRQGYDVIYILRHPLDIIVSLAAKMSSVAPGKQRPELALNHTQWFADVVETLVRYCEGLVAHQHELRLVGYERLMTDPAAEIKRLAAMIGVNISAEQTANIWQSVDGRAVSGAQHFFAPGAGKWKHYLTAKHRSIVMSSDLPALARKLGYEIAVSDFSDTPDAPETNETAVDPRFSWLDAILEIPIGKPASFTKKITRIENDVGLAGFFDAARANDGRALMKDTDLALLARSAWLVEDELTSQTVRDLLTPPRATANAFLTATRRR